MKHPRAWLTKAIAADLHPRRIDDPGVAEIQHLPVPDGAIRVLHVPHEGGRPVVMVPGFGATLEGWEEFYGLTMGRVNLYVIETLEKSTTRLDSQDPDLSVARMAEDIQRALDHLGLAGADFVLAGSCWGATIILEGLIRGALDAPTVFAYDPMHSMWFSPWVLKHLTPRLPVGLIDKLRGPIGAVALAGMTQEVQRRRSESFSSWRWTSPCGSG